MTPSRIALVIAHLAGNALLLWLGYYWLGLDESDRPHLAWSAAVILCFIVAAAWLHGLALAHFSGLPLFRAAGRSGRHLLSLFAVSLLAIAIYGALFWLLPHLGGISYTVASFATMKLHKPVTPLSVQKGFHILVLLLQWVVLPAVLLPLAAAVSVEGWSGFRWRSLRHRRMWLYWIETAALLFCAIWVPFKLFFWVPRVEPFNAQFVSFLLRVGTGYLLFVTSLLLLEFFTSSGRPLETQPSTVASP